jgi:hypothetical protein
MAVRNTRTGGARKRVAGEPKKGGKTTQAKKPATKPATRQLMTAGMLKRMQERSAPKPTSKDSESISRRRPNVINEPQSRPKTPTSKEPSKPAVKKPVPAKQNPGNMQQISNSKRANYIKGTGTK